MWQVEVTVFPLLSVAVQLVQCEVMLALAGVVNNAALKTMAPRLTSKSIFFFTSEFSLSVHSTGNNELTFYVPPSVTELLVTAAVGW